MDDNTKLNMTYEQKAAQVAKEMQAWLRENIPELRGAAVIFHWRENLKDVSVPFIWNSFEENNQDMDIPQLEGLGHGLEALTRFRLAMLMKKEHELTTKIKKLHEALKEHDGQDPKTEVTPGAVSGGSSDSDGYPENPQD